MCRTCSAFSTRSTTAKQRVEPDAGQRALGPRRAAGRLPRRRLGGQRQPEVADPRAGRRREGARDRAGDRRRPAADRGARLCGARQLHPRLVGAARQVADGGPEDRAGLVLRHVLAITRPGRDEFRSMRCRHCERPLGQRARGSNPGIVGRSTIAGLLRRCAPRDDGGGQTYINLALAKSDALNRWRRYPFRSLSRCAMASAG